MNDITVTDTSPDKDMMMLKVIESGNIEALERFISLRERERTREAAIEFDAHFSEMQAEFPVVYKRKIARDYGGNEMYKYAPLEELQVEFQPIIAKHGFAYTFSEESIEGGKRITMRISGHGSERLNHYDVPTLDTNKRTNAAQAGGGTSSYGQRYAFKAGFGLIIADEDNDAQDDRDPAEYADAIADISDAQNMDDLMEAWKAIYTRHSGDTYAMKILTAAKDKRKAALQ